MSRTVTPTLHILVIFSLVQMWICDTPQCKKKSMFSDFLFEFQEFLGIYDAPFAMGSILSIATELKMLVFWYGDW